MRTCTRCHETKDDEDFAFKVEARGWRQSWCRPCHKAYKDEHYQRNREHLISKAVERRRSAKEGRYVWLWDYFKSHPCVDCGENDPVVLEFDHIHGDKVAGIAEMMDAPWKRLLDEIEKCVVRCSNCHKRKTAKQLGWYKNYAGLV